jgi:hypothetical protein
MKRDTAARRAPEKHGMRKGIDGNLPGRPPTGGPNRESSLSSSQ